MLPLNIPLASLTLTGKLMISIVCAIKMIQGSIGLMSNKELTYTSPNFVKSTATIISNITFKFCNSNSNIKSSRFI